MRLSCTNLISAEQLTYEDTQLVMRIAADMEKVCLGGGDDRLRKKILASLFYEPSTRTRLSFESAMYRLGGEVITSDGFQFSSLYKGETIEDSIRMVCGYADIIAMRHPQLGSAAVAAAVSDVPFINAGDGPGQHPSQALLDLFTILRERGSVEGAHVAFVGDLLYGRTVHSLCALLSLYQGVRFTFVSPKELAIPEKFTASLRKNSIPFTESNDIGDALAADILYSTRIQKERFADEAEYDRLKHVYVLDAQKVSRSKAIIMHPLPRVGEITTDVDSLPNAAYFRQARNGLYVRMALLALMLDAV